MEKNKSIRIPDHLHNELQKHLSKTAFKDVNELSVYILQNYLEQKDKMNLTGSSPEECEEIRKRLENLGYL
ncbi:MAG: hypothetical protein JXR46_00340 [Calditrichaceae bacterium]|nr:hypothetical protein [Calditrichaceae bacterium]MBN2707461.1 hypothetical protein [Calditrichaceae bacterium]RQV94028.1 MAG: hypothetical protein EH224_11335 [Calditrichota bacterium]